MARVKVPCTIDTTADDVVVLIPTSELSNSKTYYIKATTDVKSETGYNLNSEFNSEFTTAEPTPVPFIVTAIDPLNDATNVLMDTSVEITFNKEYDKLTAIEDNIYMEKEVISGFTFRVTLVRPV